MDWKAHYRNEMLEPATKAYLEGLFSSLEQDKEIDSLLRRGAILSFPHTAAHYIGPLQARVVSALYRLGIKHIIALGVLHTSTLPAPYDEYYRTALDDERPSSRRQEAYAALQGGFVPDCRVIETAFGTIPCERIANGQIEGVRIDRMGLLQNEFSLDSFFSLTSLYAKVHRMLPIPVLPIYVGMTRDPVSGSFAVADDLADLLRSMVAPDTAIVTTGDIVHYGTAYTPAEKMLDLDEEELEPLFRRECERIFSLAITKQDLVGAFHDSNEILRSDQRYILPAIVKYLGQNAGFRILSFSLSDYSQILETARPCVVASALVAYVPAS
ncbi:MAG TPA: hypothetical protein ENL23_00275 [Candidatus Acetothermia bacterium]|nr:hypothetical protein [Candidatus Acetothermia bacterium]